MRGLGIQILTHMPAGKDGRRITARAKGKVVECYAATALPAAAVALFERRGWLSPEAVADPRHWEPGGGFSLDAGIRIHAEARAGWERLLRYGARPVYAKPELLATAPNQVWSWDITKLKGPAKWTCFHL
jgi:transposase InsO family protein